MTLLQCFVIVWVVKTILFYEGRMGRFSVVICNFGDVILAAKNIF